MKDVFFLQGINVVIIALKIVGVFFIFNNYTFEIAMFIGYLFSADIIKDIVILLTYFFLRQKVMILSEENDVLQDELYNPTISVN